MDGRAQQVVAIFREIVCMEKIYRDGLDIDVALAVAARRAMAPAARAAAPGAPSAAEFTLPGPPGEPAPLTGVKRWLRRPVARIFRLLKPFLRPLAFRARRYLTDALREDFQSLHASSQQEIQRVSDDVLREVQSARELLRREIIAAQGEPPHSEMLSGLLLELQDGRDQLRRDLLAEQRRSMRALEQAMAALAVAGREQAGSGMQALQETVMPRLDRIEQYGHAAARRVAVYCGADEILVKTEAGYMMCSGADHAVLTCLVETGELERGTRLLIERLLVPGNVFVDVGANLGIHTLAAGRALRGQGRIIAFEPFEPTRRLLEKSVWINGLSDVTRIDSRAVSSHAGRRPLFLGRTSGHHSLFPLDGGADSGAGGEVDTVPLDAALDPALRVTLLKIDVEGAELDVLEGAAGLVRNNPDMALIVEFGPSHLKRTGQSTAAWLAAFAKFDLVYQAIDDITGALAIRSAVQLEAATSTNLLFARAGAPVWSKAGGQHER
jgi:FkbM family methyltransferase